MIEALDDGTWRTVSAGVNNARINGSLLDVSNPGGSKIRDLMQKVRCGTINPYRDAVMMNAQDVLKEIPRKQRGAMRVGEVGAVLAALHTIAKRSEQ